MLTGSPNLWAQSTWRTSSGCSRCKSSGRQSSAWSRRSATGCALRGRLGSGPWILYAQDTSRRSPEAKPPGTAGLPGALLAGDGGEQPARAPAVAVPLPPHRRAVQRQRQGAQLLHRGHHPGPAPGAAQQQEHHRRHPRPHPRLGGGGVHRAGQAVGSVCSSPWISSQQADRVLLAWAPPRSAARRGTRRWRCSCATRSRPSCWQATRPARPCCAGRCTS